jgi:SPP1 gp7 family putative phage head morphogenesis protein
MLVFKAWRKSPALTQETTPSQRRITRILSDAQQAAAREFGERQREVADLLSRGQVDRVVAMLPTEPWLVAQEQLAAELLGELLDAGSRVKLPTIEKATLEFSFDRGRPESVSWARQEAGNLISQITGEQRNVVRDVVALAGMGDADWGDVSREVQGSIGLTTQQAGWVSNYYDRAFSQQIRAGASPSQAAARARDASARYQTSVHRYRANTIARTETMRAASEGRMQAWNQGLTDGFISPLWDKEWVAEADACDICQGLDRNRVKVKESFSVGDPPAHPNCRCDVILVPPNVKPQSAGGFGFTLPDVLFNLPIDDLLFNLLFNQPLPRIPGWGPRQPAPEVTRPPEPPKFRQPGEKPSFDDIVDNAEEIIDEMMARAQEAIDAGDSDTSLGDSMLSAIYRRMGYEGLPQVVDEDIFEQLAQEQTIWFRGMQAFGREADDFLDMLRFGDYYAGYGTFGNGTYASNYERTAVSYGAGRLGNVIRILLSPTARVIESNDLMVMYRDWHRQFGATGPATMLMDDMGRFAAAKGYDAIMVTDIGLGGPGGKESYIVILNRNLMVLPKANGLGPNVIERNVLERAWNEAVANDPSILQTFGSMYSYARSRGFKSVWEGSTLYDLTMFD